MRPEHTGSESRRQQQHVAFCGGISGAAVIEPARALDTYQHGGHTRRADGKRQVSVQARQPEVLTVKEPLAFHGRGRLNRGRHETARTFSKVNAGQRLLDLERAGLARLGVNMAPVVQAKRHVAVLLNLEHHDAATQRVDRPSRQEDGVAGFRREAREATGHRSVRERLPQIGFRGAWLQACLDAAVWPRLQHDPRFGFAGLARWQQVRVRIRGMNLHREQLTCVEELQQQRESAESPGQLSH